MSAWVMPGKPPGSQQNRSTWPALASNPTNRLLTHHDRTKMIVRPGRTGNSVGWPRLIVATGWSSTRTRYPARRSRISPCVRHKTMRAWPAGTAAGWYVGASAGSPYQLVTGLGSASSREMRFSQASRFPSMVKVSSRPFAKPQGQGRLARPGRDVAHVSDEPGALAGDIRLVRDDEEPVGGDDQPASLTAVRRLM